MSGKEVLLLFSLKDEETRNCSQVCTSREKRHISVNNLYHQRIIKHHMSLEKIEILVERVRK